MHLTHPPIWLMWAVIVYLPLRPIVGYVWRLFRPDDRWKDWGKDYIDKA